MTRIKIRERHDGDGNQLLQKPRCYQFKMGFLPDSAFTRINSADDSCLKVQKQNMKHVGCQMSPNSFSEFFPDMQENVFVSGSQAPFVWFLSSNNYKPVCSP